MANHDQKKGLKMFIKLEYPHVCKVPQQRLKKCLESKWDVIVNKLKKPINEALLGVLGIRYIYPKYFGYKVLLNTDFWV